MATKSIQGNLRSTCKNKDIFFVVLSEGNFVNDNLFVQIFEYIMFRNAFSLIPITCFIAPQISSCNFVTRSPMYLESTQANYHRIEKINVIILRLIGFLNKLRHKLKTEIPYFCF